MFKNGGLLEYRNTWDSILNVSSEMHADVVAGSQLIKLDFKPKGIFMTEYLYQPCRSLIATSCFEFTMASSSDEGRVTSSFTEIVYSCTEGELAIDEGASKVSLPPTPCCPRFNCGCEGRRRVCLRLSESSEKRGVCSGSSGFWSWGCWWREFRR